MILGLSHIGLTVSNLERAIEYYRTNLGCQVLSIAERKGEWVEKITGIPGFHTKTAYLALSPYRHFEIFEFFYPKAIPMERENGIRVGPLYCVLKNTTCGSLLPRDEQEKTQRWLGLVGKTEPPFGGCRIIHSQDPEGSYLRIIEKKKDKETDKSKVPMDMLYPVFGVANMFESLYFYEGLLGMHVDCQGEFSVETQQTDDARTVRSMRWTLLRSKTGFSLKLVSPVNSKILPATPWKMERIGLTHVAFGVEDLEAYYRKLRNKVHFRSPPTSINAGPHQGGKAVYVTSPEGITLEFMDSPQIRKELTN